MIFEVRKMNFIRKIFENKFDDCVRKQLRRFSKGKFENRALVYISKKSKGASIKTSFEFANELVSEAAKKLNGKTLVRGAILSTRELELPFKTEIKRFQQVKRYFFEEQLNGEEILKLQEKYPETIFMLSFSSSDFSLRIKTDMPTSGKPSKKIKGDKGDGEKTGKIAKPGYCFFNISDPELVKDLAFDSDNNFKTFYASHDFFIMDIILPKNIKNFVEARELAKRKVKIIRKLDIDGRKIVKEKEFEA